MNQTDSNASPKLTLGPINSFNFPVFGKSPSFLQKLPEDFIRFFSFPSFVKKKGRYNVCMLPESRIIGVKREGAKGVHPL